MAGWLGTRRASVYIVRWRVKIFFFITKKTNKIRRIAPEFYTSLYLFDFIPFSSFTTNNNSFVSSWTRVCTIAVLSFPASHAYKHVWFFFCIYFHLENNKKVNFLCIFFIFININNFIKKFQWKSIKNKKDSLIRKKVTCARSYSLSLPTNTFLFGLVWCYLKSPVSRKRTELHTLSIVIMIISSSSRAHLPISESEWERFQTKNAQWNKKKEEWRMKKNTHDTNRAHENNTTEKRQP